MRCAGLAQAQQEARQTQQISADKAKPTLLSHQTSQTPDAFELVKYHPELQVSLKHQEAQKREFAQTAKAPSGLDAVRVSSAQGCASQFSVGASRIHGLKLQAPHHAHVCSGSIGTYSYYCIGPYLNQARRLSLPPATSL